MNSNFIYSPFFRVRQEEIKVFTRFAFAENMIPGIEIIKGLMRQPPKRKKVPVLISAPAAVKPFESVYLPIISAIRSNRVFVDIPVHMEQKKTTKKDVLAFLRGVADKREVRTEYLLKLAPLAKKIIPVISTYWKRRSEPGSIKKQEADLRGTFKSLAYRTFLDTFEQDILQILEIAQPQDFLILDLKDSIATLTDPDLNSIIETLGNFKTCPVIILRNVISKNITNLSLSHGLVVGEIDNSLLRNYKQLNAHGFGDYAGIKKDDVTSQGGNKNTKPSPGFIIYDPTSNSYFGFRGSEKRDWADYEDVIVPDVISSPIAANMGRSSRDYLGAGNAGWTLLKKIHDKTEKGKSAGKFKRISMEHYMHCVRTMIYAGDFN